MRNLSKYLGIIGLYLVSQFSPIQAQTQYSQQDSIRNLAREVAKNAIRYGEREKNSYELVWVILIDENRGHEVRINFYDRNSNAKPDSLDELKINSEFRDHKDGQSNETYIDKGLDGIVNRMGDWYFSEHQWKENGKRMHAEGWYEPFSSSKKELSRINKMYLSALEYILNVIKREY